MKELRLSRGLLSAYYIAILFGNLLFALPFFKEVIAKGQDAVATFIRNVTNSELTTTWISWISLFFVCFLFVFVIRKYIVEPLGFFIDDESNLNTWELAILTILVFGALLYYINIHFGQPMPEEIPTFITDALANKPVSSNSIIPVIWNLGPILFMYITFRNRLSSGE